MDYPMKKNTAIKNILMICCRVMILGICGLISIFLLMSGYESIYNRSLPFVHTLDPINLSAFMHGYDLSSAATPNPKSYGNFGQPITVKLPLKSLRLNVVAPIRDGTIWLARANTLHLLIPRPPRSGNIGMALFYCRSSFRTVNAENLPT